MEALHKVSFGKPAFAMVCRQDKQGQRRYEDKDLVLTTRKPGCLVLQEGQAEFQILMRSWAAPGEGIFFSFKEVKFVFISKQHSNSCDEAQRVSSVLILIRWLYSELNLWTM